MELRGILISRKMIGIVRKMFQIDKYSIFKPNKIFEGIASD